MSATYPNSTVNLNRYLQFDNRIIESPLPQRMKLMFLDYLQPFQIMLKKSEEHIRSFRLCDLPCHAYTSTAIPAASLIL